MMPDNVMDLAQFGFAAVMAWMLWTFIRNLFPQLLEIIARNSEAMERVAGAVDSNTKSVEGLRDVVAGIDTRLVRLEERQGK